MPVGAAASPRSALVVGQMHGKAGGRVAHAPVAAAHGNVGGRVRAITNFVLKMDRAVPL